MTKKESLNDEGIDVRLWLASVIAVVSVGFGVGAMTSAGGVTTTSNINTNTTPDISSSTPFSVHHMIYDMKNVDKEFLKSEDRIQEAISKSTKALDLDLISSGCHLLEETSSYSCLMVMEQGQGAIHSFPENGVISIDLAVHDDKKSLIEAAAIIKEHFAIGDDVTTLWTIDQRGEPESRKNQNTLTMSSAVYTEKNHVFSTKTDYHQVDIWQTKSADGRVTYENTLKHNLQPGDPRWTTNELSPHDFDVFVNGLYIASSDREEALDAELDVHPVMFAHPNPKRVAFSSSLGDEGLGLQQILRHDIESVTVFQPDEDLVNIIKTHVPNAYDCSKIDGIADDCLSDELVHWIKKGGRDWFPVHYGESKSESTDAAFDVVLADAFTPERADSLSALAAFIIKSLSSDGVLGVNLGIAPTILHPRLSFGYFKNHDKLMQVLEALPDVEAVIVYDDDFSLNDEGAEVAPNVWLLACKNANCRDNFYASPDVVDSKIAARIVRAKDGKMVPQYFDGAVNHGLQAAPKAFETIYCRRDPVPFECQYRNLDFSREIFDYNENEEESAFSIQVDDSNPDSVQSSVVARVAIPAGSYIMASDVSKSLVIDPSVLEEVNGLGEPSCTAKGSIVEIGPSRLIRSAPSEEEANVGQWVPSHPDGKRPKYSPVYDNHGHSFAVFLVATKDIQQGEELVRYSNT
ncbi:unnamed protein product [Cylindrotheca closterium]|uniref:SET domain-containing protein n=1 Tax=Cylindrotheca closterium TaxID=2856 RepID=A0AAD2CPJ4_9STRA|nr:unnamed protein product [Cylindrotheca closterium]